MLNMVKNDEGKHAWNRWLSVVAALALTQAFLKQAYSTDFQGAEFFYYSIAMTICYSPVYAIKLLEVWKGKNVDPIHDVH
jgi:hypothetical protein